MNPRQMAILLLAAGSSMTWGADTKENLTQARSQYQQAVTQHGPESPEAKTARKHLRAARRSFHAERRERMHDRHSR
jgi:hypothetical protein